MGITPGSGREAKRSTRGNRGMWPRAEGTWMNPLVYQTESLPCDHNPRRWPGFVSPLIHHKEEALGREIARRSCRTTFG